MNSILSKLKLKLFRWQHPEAEQLSDAAKQCCKQANQIAIQAGAQKVNTAHLLLAILQTDLAKTLDMDGSLTRATQKTIEQTPSDNTETFKPVLEQAIIEARELQKSVIDPLLLFLGLSTMTNTIGGKLIASNQITTQQIRSIID